MTHLDPARVRPVPQARNSRATAIPASSAGRRRAVCFAACMATLAAALVLPSSAHAGWPLEESAPVVLGFGATYAAADGTSSTHRGVDLAAAAGSAVRSPLSGRVTFAGRVPGPGGGTVLAMTIAGASGSLTLLPLSSAAAKTGAELAEGDVVGVLAGTGDASSSTAHLHVGARKGDLYIDPLTLMAPPGVARGDAPEPPQPVPAQRVQPEEASAEVAAAAQAQGAAHAAALPPSVSALQPAGTPAVRAGTVGVNAPAGAVVPGASVAPGVSIAGAVDGQAMSGSTMEAVSAAFSAAVGERSHDRSGEGSPAGALVEWALGMAARGVRTGARVLAGVLLALGALWPIWRRERRKGTGQLSVRPVGDDVAAVAGR